MQLYIIIPQEALTAPMEVLHYLEILRVTIILLLEDNHYIGILLVQIIPLQDMHLFYQIQLGVITAPMVVFHYLVTLQELIILQ